MRHFSRWIALLLTLVLLCGCVAGAHAETTYLILQSLLSDTEESSVGLGTPVVMSYEDVSREWLLLIYDADDKSVSLAGFNADAQGEASFWGDVETDVGIYLIYSMCSVWDVLQKELPDGYGIALGLVSEESDLNVWINSAELAAQFKSLFDQSAADGTAE